MTQSSPRRDPLNDTVADLVTVAACAVLVLLVLPLVAPAMVLTLGSPYAATRARYWIVPRWWRPVVGGGIAAVVLLLSLEGLLAAGWIGDEHALFARSLVTVVPALWGAAWPWLIVNACSGLLLVPAAMALLGDRAWWLPRTLERWMPAVDLDPHDEPDNGRAVEPRAADPVVSDHEAVELTGRAHR